MRSRNFFPELPLIVATILIGLGACDMATIPESGDAPVEASAPAPVPVYRSAKKVSSDCGVEHLPSPPPGFAEAPGVELKELPKPVAGFLAVGADREPVESDPERLSPGFVLVEPLAVSSSLLVNNQDGSAFAFKGDRSGGFGQFLPNGNRLVSNFSRPGLFTDGGGYRGCIEEYSADGSLLWRMKLSTDNYIHHHDVVKMDNGNILAVVWERVPADEAISQGRNPEDVAESGDFWYDGIIEINPYTLDIVWEWSARHHLVQDFDRGKHNYGVVAEHPELLDINVVHRSPPDNEIDADWTHVNAIDYNPALDQIVLSSNYMSEIWIIDHSTTPYESAGHSGGRYGKGGDLLYRWGNPGNYGRATDDNRMLYRQHDVQWIKSGLAGAGNLLLFNNGDAKLRPYSTVVELAPPMNADGSYQLADGKSYGPEALIWEYNPEPPERFFSFFISGAQRLPNGNTLVNQGAGAKVREVTSEGDIVWDYAYTDDIDAPHALFRANWFPADHPAVVGILSRSGR